MSAWRIYPGGRQEADAGCVLDPRPDLSAHGFGLIPLTISRSSPNRRCSGSSRTVALTVATGYFQQRQMTARLPKDSLNPQMQMVTKLFPEVIGVVSLSVPAGVVVYFIVSDLWQIAQQAVTFRALPPPHRAE